MKNGHLGVKLVGNFLGPQEKDLEVKLPWPPALPPKCGQAPHKAEHSLKFLRLHVSLYKNVVLEYSKS